MATLKPTGIKINQCPICESMPILKIEDMGRPGGHGYPGCDSYEMYCPYCNLPKHVSSDTIYRSAEEAQKAVVEAWNAEVDRVKGFMHK